MNNTYNPCMNKFLSPKQFQLFNIIRRLWMEHIFWTTSVVNSSIMNLKNLDAVSQRLLQNPVDFAKALKPLYGSEKATTFEKLLTEHLQIAAIWLESIKAEDTEAIEKNRKSWYKNADEIAIFLSSINPHWSRKVWQLMLYDHLKMIENEVMYVSKEQFERGIAENDSMQSEALEMANYMACGIIMQLRI